MNDLSVSPELLQRGYEAMGALISDMFSSDDEMEAALEVTSPQSGYLGLAEVNAVPAYSQTASCSIFRVCERKTQTFTILGLMLMLFGSCGTVAVGAKQTTPTVRPAYKDDPFTTMNGYGDRVY